jgi:hypothetical protein
MVYGRVYVQFAINPKGGGSVKIGVDPALDKEALRWFCHHRVGAADREEDC